MKIIRPITITTAALTASNVPETDYAAWNSGTTYALAQRAIYISGNNHWIVESLQAGNINHVPTGLATDTWWLKIGNTNRWKMFDQAVNSQTSNLDSINDTVTLSGRADSVALLNISGASVQIQMTDTIDGLVYDQTYSLVSDSGINDWYRYFFEPIVRLTDFTIGDMPPYNNASINVVISDAGNTVLCGCCIFGLSQYLGATQYGMSLGITDYSVKQQDDFGNYTILERAYRRTSDMSLWVENNYIDQLVSALVTNRATPTVYIGADNLSSSIVYGFYKDFSVNVSYPDISLCTLSLEGLT